MWHFGWKTGIAVPGNPGGGENGKPGIRRKLLIQRRYRILRRTGSGSPIQTPKEAIRALHGTGLWKKDAD